MTSSAILLKQVYCYYLICVYDISVSNFNIWSLLFLAILFRCQINYEVFMEVSIPDVEETSFSCQFAKNKNILMFSSFYDGNIVYDVQISFNYFNCYYEGFFI